eukprot:GHVU01004685.1.p1 GENE.GHVU01004685.1~~GHVU01004685.1.p1  ORF type:complete len:120 (-),score=6.76 GHVU01004685.1:278-637(-)
MRNFSLPSALLPHRVEETDQRELAAMHPPVEEAAKLKEAQVPLPGLTQSAPEEEHRDYHPKVMNDSDGSRYSFYFAILRLSTTNLQGQTQSWGTRVCGWHDLFLSSGEMILSPQSVGTG